MTGQHSRSESLFYYFRIEDQVPCAICCHFGCVIIDPADMVPKPSSLVRRIGFKAEVRGCVEAAAFDALSVYKLARPKQRATGGDTPAVGVDRRICLN